MSKEDVTREGVEFIRKLDEYGGVRDKLIVLKEALTDPAYGKLPTHRSVDELLDLGVVNLDKPPGPTSHEVVAWLKNILGIEKAGHGGTLERP